MNLKTLAVRTATVLIACGAATTLAGGLANAATPTTTPQTPATITVDQDHSLAKGSTGITMTVINNTGQKLTLIGAQNPYGHWQNRATSMTPGQAPITVSDYSDNIEGAQITLEFVTDDGTMITLQSDAPLAGPSSANGDSSSSAHSVQAAHSGSFHTDDTYTIS